MFTGQDTVRRGMTRLADAPTPGFDEGYFSTFGTTESDFPMMVNFDGTDYIVDDEMELGKLRIGRTLRQAIPTPVRRVVAKVTPLIPGAALVSKTERRKLRKMIPKPIRAVAKRIAPIAVPGAMLFAPVRKTAVREIRGVIKPVVGVGRRKPGVAPEEMAPEMPAPIDTVVTPTGPPPEVGPRAPGAEAGSGRAPGGGMEPEPTVPEAEAPEVAPSAPKGGLGRRGALPLVAEIRRTRHASLHSVFTS